MVKTSTKRLFLQNCSIFLWIVRFFLILTVLSILTPLSKNIVSTDYQRVIYFVTFLTLMSICQNCHFLPEKIFTILFKSVQNVHMCICGAAGYHLFFLTPLVASASIGFSGQECLGYRRRISLRTSK